MDDLLLVAIHKSSIEENSCAAALLNGRAAMYLYAEAEQLQQDAIEYFGSVPAQVQAEIQALWDAARILFAAREFVREIGRNYSAGAVVRGEF